MNDRDALQKIWSELQSADSSSMEHEFKRHLTDIASIVSEQMKTVPAQITEEMLNRMAQYFYEATPTIVYPAMTMKEDIVEGLRAALVRTNIISAQKPIRQISEAWDIIYLHDSCPECEACADRAIAHARAHFLVSDQWTIRAYTGDGEPYTSHRAIIERA